MSGIVFISLFPGGGWGRVVGWRAIELLLLLLVLLVLLLLLLLLLVLMLLLVVEGGSAIILSQNHYRQVREEKVCIKRAILRAKCTRMHFLQQIIV